MYTYISCQIIKTSTLKTVRAVRPKQMDGRTRVNNIEFGTFCLVHFRNHKTYNQKLSTHSIQRNWIKKFYRNVPLKYTQIGNSSVC